MAKRRLKAGHAKGEALQNRIEKVNLVYLGLWAMIDAANSRRSSSALAFGPLPVTMAKTLDRSTETSDL